LRKRAPPRGARVADSGGRRRATRDPDRPRPCRQRHPAHAARDCDPRPYRDARRPGLALGGGQRPWNLGRARQACLRTLLPRRRHVHVRRRPGAGDRTRACRAQGRPDSTRVAARADGLHAVAPARDRGDSHVARLSRTPAFLRENGRAPLPPDEDAWLQWPPWASRAGLSLLPRSPLSSAASSALSSSEPPPAATTGRSSSTLRPRRIRAKAGSPPYRSVVAGSARRESTHVARRVSSRSIRTSAIRTRERLTPCKGRVSSSRRAARSLRTRT